MRQPLPPASYQGRIVPGMVFKHRSFSIYCKAVSEADGIILVNTLSAEGEVDPTPERIPASSFRYSWLPSSL